MVDGRKGGTVGFRLPSQPEFLFSEEATVHHRSWSENLTYYTGTGYLSGAPNLQALEKLVHHTGTAGVLSIPTLWCLWCCRQLAMPQKQKTHVYIPAKSVSALTEAKQSSSAKTTPSGAGLLPFAACLSCWGIPRLLAAAVHTC